ILPALPGHHPATIGKRSNRRFLLPILGMTIDPPLIAHFITRGIKALLIDAPSGTILTPALPGHHPAAIGKDSDVRPSLVTVGRRIDQSLIANLGTVWIETLHVYIPASTRSA